jgi:hypothetical protein
LRGGESVSIAPGKFESAPGILGTIGAAIVFAEFLFDPAFGLRVSDSKRQFGLDGYRRHRSIRNSGAQPRSQREEDFGV